jgi:pSer/pThr/pTyr-binding forkhead associated (FHA) protein
MASHHDHEFDASKPALVLLYGNTSKKHRALDRDVILVGRARGCDLGLEAADVSSIHCVITRHGSGFAVRDCQSRSGTKVNGNLVRETVLHDGDLLQLGPFSFRVHLPHGFVAAAAPAGSRLHHLEQSRRNFARLALKQRQLLRLEKPALTDSRVRLAVEEQLGKKASALKLRVKDYDQRVRVLEEAERDLTRDREALQGERAAFQQQVQKKEDELAARGKRAEAEYEAKKKQLAGSDDSTSAVDLGGGGISAGARQQLQQEQQELQRHAGELDKREADVSRREAALAQGRLELDARSQQQQHQQREVEALNQRLEKREQKLQALEHNLQPRIKEHETRCRELDAHERELAASAKQSKQRGEELKDQAHKLEQAQQALQTEASKLQQRQRDLDALARQLEHREKQAQGQQGPLDDQRLDLTAQQQQFTAKVQAFERLQKEYVMMRDQWAQDQSAILERLGQQKAALAQAEETLHEQRQNLDDLLADLQEARPAAAPADDGILQQLREENDKLRQNPVRDAAQDGRIQELQSENDDLKRLLAAVEEQRQSAAPPAETEAPTSSAEVERLRKLVAQREAEIREMNRQTEEAMGRTETRFVEAQLSEYRRQLENDRQKLSREIEQVRVRNQELDEATRELELEMSRERAELGRERQRLERLREDVRLEMERAQRESGVRERLAPVQSLREEITGKRQSVNDQTPKPGKEDRTRGLRN